MNNLLSTILYISHGGGPLPLLGEPSHSEMVQGLQSIANQIKEPDGIIVVSAHWETEHVEITASNTPDILYDYAGFPPEAYTIEYPAPGLPDLAAEVHQLFQSQNIHSTLNNDRGFDHGLYVPLKIMYPEANIPCIQISLLRSLDPASHIAIGKALALLQRPKILIIGSGFSFHNMNAFFTKTTAAIEQKNMDFDRWLTSVCSHPTLDEEQRMNELIQWEQAPSARFCHPREEHLLPLHVCYGVAQSAAKQIFSWKIMNKQVSGFLWEKG